MTVDLRLINASAGTGEAVRSLVTVNRSIGATVLTVDANTNWPAYFIATTGSLDTNGRLAPATIQVFKGHRSGGTYVIDSFAPGYTDKGNIVGDVVLIKPATAWADQVQEFMGVSNNQDGTLKPSAVQVALQSIQSLDWLPTNTTLSSATYNGNRSYSGVTAADISSFIAPGMRMRITRTAAAPTQSALLNGTNQYFSKSSPAGMTFTDDFVVSAWVKLSNYPTGNATIISRYNGTSGWKLYVGSDGTVLLIGFNGGSGNLSYIQSYQSLPLNKWVHIAAQLDMSAFTATSITSYIMMDGVDVPAKVLRSGTNPTALVQAGNLEVGSTNGGTEPFPGKIAQVAIYSAKVTQANILATISQGLVGTETSLISAYSLSNSVNDLTANANNLTAQGSAVTTNADSPFGNQSNGTISSTLEYAIVQAINGTNIVLQSPEGGAIPTTGGTASIAYSAVKSPYRMPVDSSKWSVVGVTRVNGSGGAISANTWYGDARTAYARLRVPVGAWNLKAAAPLYIEASTPSVLYANLTLSDVNAGTGSSTAYDKEMVDAGGVYSAYNTILSASVQDSRKYDTATTLYMNIASGYPTNITNLTFVLNSNFKPIMITATNEYL